MRLAPIQPADLNPTGRSLHNEIVKRMAKSLFAFDSRDARGGLLGPFPPLLRFPIFGEPAFRFLDTLVEGASLPATVREIAILVVGARFNARYELYSHEKMAEATDLVAAQISAIVAGQRPSDLSDAQSAAYDFAAASVATGSVPNATYNRAVHHFSEDGVGELAFLVGGYALICILLNAFDMPVPDTEG